MSAIVTWFQVGSTPVAGTEVLEGNPIEFGTLEPGQISTPDSDYYPVNLWNGRNVGTASTMTSVTLGLSVVSGSGNTAQLYTGTAGNNYQPMLEAYSNGAYGCADDGQTNWTAIGNGTRLSIGNVPTNCMRQIYYRLNIPYDADAVEFVAQPDVQYLD